MSTWNYRVLYSKEHDEEYFAIHEVYYNDNKEADGYVDTPAVVMSDEAEGMVEVLKMFSAALEKPIIDKANFPQEYKPKTNEKP